MRLPTALVVGLVAALLLGGCGDGGKDLGVTVGPGQGPSTEDYDKRIAEVQANTHMPDSAKQIQLGQLQAAKAKAAAERK